MNQNDLIGAIRTELTEKCRARALDDKNDFEAVMEVIGSAVEGYLKDRCEGCK